MAGTRKKGKESNQGIFGLSTFGFAALAAFSLLLLFAAFLLGEFYLFIRNPRGEVTVPDFVGMEFSDAEAAAHKARLNLRISKLVYSDDVGKDFIVDQEPTSGVDVKEGRTIYLTVSEGRRDIPSPNLLGLDSEEALAKIEAMGLLAAEPQMRYSDKAPAGKVINQSPPPGTPVAKGEKILTIISKGPQMKNMEMPDLDDLTLEEAITLLDQIGLRVSRITRRYSPTAHEERVSSQAPAPGRIIKRGDEVILTVTTPSYKRALGERQFRVVVNVPASEDGIEVSIVKNDFQETKEIFRKLVLGPSRVEKLVDAYGSTTISIYFNGELYREETF